MAIRLGRLAIGLEAIASRLEAVAIQLGAIPETKKERKNEKEQGRY